MQAISMPFSFSNGGVTATSDLATITENKIIDVLVTYTAERAINTNYGIGISSLLYEPLESLVFDDFKSDALVKINEAIDSGKVLDISIDYPNSIQMSYVEDSAILITVVYSLPTTNNTRTFTFNVSADF